MTLLTPDLFAIRALEGIEAFGEEKGHLERDPTSDRDRDMEEK